MKANVRLNASVEEFLAHMHYSHHRRNLANKRGGGEGNSTMGIRNFNLRRSRIRSKINPYPTAFPYGNGMVLHFYQQQESSTTKTVHKVINTGLKTYV